MRNFNTYFYNQILKNPVLLDFQEIDLSNEVLSNESKTDKSLNFTPYHTKAVFEVVD